MTDQNIKAFCAGLEDLMQKHNIATIGVDIDGDTHGISDQFIIEEKGGAAHVISAHSAYIDRLDLLEYLTE